MVCGQDGERGLVIAQKWEESELGWGTRPDGFSIHLSEEDRQKFVQNYWADMPQKLPDTYSRPVGVAKEISVESELLLRVRESKNGIFVRWIK